MATVEEWLKVRTFQCERLRARISPMQCLQNQMRAKIDQISMISVTCSECEQGREIVESRIDSCPVCGRQKETWQTTCGRPKCKAKFGRDKLDHKEAVETREVVKILDDKMKEVARVVGTEKKSAEPEPECECIRCGVKFEPYQAGVVTVKNVCRECRLEAISEAKRKTPKDGGKKKEAKAMKSEKKSNGDTKIIVDLSEYPEVFEAMKEMAKREFRPVEMQAAWILYRATEDLRGGDSASNG